MPGDNALAESFFASLKNERVHHMVYPTRKKAKDDTMATKGGLSLFRVADCLTNIGVITQARTVCSD